MARYGNAAEVHTGEGAPLPHCAAAWIQRPTVCVTCPASQAAPTLCVTAAELRCCLAPARAQPPRGIAAWLRCIWRTGFVANGGSAACCYTVGVSDSKRPEGPLSAVSRLSGLSRDEVYRRFRLEGAPAPVNHVACVPVYDLEAAVAWLLPPDRGQPTSIDLAPVRPSGLAASQPPV
jgi:hypothetical protein